MTDQPKEWIVPIIGRRNTIAPQLSAELDFDRGLVFTWD